MLLLHDIGQPIDVAVEVPFGLGWPAPTGVATAVGIAAMDGDLVIPQPTEWTAYIGHAGVAKPTSTTTVDGPPGKAARQVVPDECPVGHTTSGHSRVSTAYPSSPYPPRRGPTSTCRRRTHSCLGTMRLLHVVLSAVSESIPPMFGVLPAPVYSAAAPAEGALPRNRPLGRHEEVCLPAVPGQDEGHSVWRLPASDRPRSSCRPPELP